MNEESTQALRAVLLPGFGVLRIAGADAAQFLQGQFTHDVRLYVDGDFGDIRAKMAYARGLAAMLNRALEQS